MAETPEAKVKKFVKNYMFAAFPGIWYYSPPGTMFGKVGIPDHLYMWNGVFIAVEAKAEGNSPTAMQTKQLLHLKEQGAVVAVVVGRDQKKMELIKAAILERISK
jgi:hypothetical protein